MPSTAARIAAVAIALFLPVPGLACEGPDNPFVNCGFEGGLSGWELDDLDGPSFPAAVVGPGVDPGFGFFSSAPAQGSRAFVTGFDGDGPGTIELSQIVLLPPDARLLAFSYRMAWDFWNWDPEDYRTFGVRIEEVGGSGSEDFDMVYLDPGTYDPDSGDLEGLLSVADWAGRLVEVVFRWEVPEAYSGPSFFQLDDVRILDEPSCVDRLPPGEDVDETLTSGCLADGGFYFVFNVASRTAPVTVSLGGSIPGLRWQLREGGPDGPVAYSDDANVVPDTLDLTRGSWTVRVLSDGGTGPFGLFLGDSFQLCFGLLSLGDTFDSFFTGLCPIQLYDFSLTTDRDVVIEMKSDHVDPFLRISDLSGRTVAFDDNSGAGDDARITASLEAGGYVVEASTPSGSPPTGNPDGGFTISARAGGGGSTPGCPLSLGDSSQSFDPGGGAHSFGIAGGAGCSWQVAVDRSWIRPTSPTSGTGSGSLAYEVLPNTASNPRTGTITVSTPETTRVHQVTQLGTNPTACVPTDGRLCLNDGRFGVEVFWETAGDSGQARVVELTSDTGYFWFFSESNVEMVLKVLDACGFADRFWVFAGGLTNVQSRIVVTDSATGASRTYFNPQGTPFQPIQDTEAFATCGASLTSSDERGAVPAAPSAVGPSEAPRTHAASPRPFADPPARRPRARVELWDQQDDLPGTGITSQDFLDPANADFDTEAADDFTVPEGDPWELTRVDVSGFYFGPDDIPDGPADSVAVAFYEDDGGLPGTAVCTYPSIVPSFRISGDFSIALPTHCMLPPGRYWVSVRANQEFATAGQWAWEERSTRSGRPSAWRNPGNGFGNGCTEWGRRLADCGVGDHPDLGFSLWGEVPDPNPPCVESATRLCLNGGRFAVDVDWTNATGTEGVGQAEQLTDDTGYFWFFDQSNVEMVIKVLDACGFADRYWVFAGGLTNVDVDITVTDTDTGAVSSYRNPQGTPFQPIQDTQAFATCP